MQKILNQHLNKIYATLIFITATQLCIVWLERNGYDYLFIVANSLDARPYVYRVLIPLLSRTLKLITGLDIVTCLIGVVSLSAICLYYSIRYLYTSFKDDVHADIITLIACEVTFLPILFYAKVYDIAAAMFFTLSLGALARKKFWLYYLIFPFATLNRETTFLLTLFFILYLFRKLPLSQWMFGIFYQVIVFSAVKMLVDAQFANLAGSHFIWSLPLVIPMYTDQYLFTVILVSFVAVFIYLALRQWYAKPSFLIAAFLIIFPVMIVLHISLGMAFELRVFSEIIPAIVILVMYPVRPYVYNTEVLQLPKKKFTRRQPTIITKQ